MKIISPIVLQINNESPNNNNNNGEGFVRKGSGISLTMPLKNKGINISSPSLLAKTAKVNTKRDEVSPRNNNITPRSPRVFNLRDYSQESANLDNIITSPHGNNNNNNYNSQLLAVPQVFFFFNSITNIIIINK